MKYFLSLLLICLTMSAYSQAKIMSSFNPISTQRFTATVKHERGEEAAIASKSRSKKQGRARKCNAPGAWQDGDMCYCSVYGSRVYCRADEGGCCGIPSKTKKFGIGAFGGTFFQSPKRGIQAEKQSVTTSEIKEEATLVRKSDSLPKEPQEVSHPFFERLEEVLGKGNLAADQAVKDEIATMEVEAVSGTSYGGLPAPSRGSSSAARRKGARRENPKLSEKRILKLKGIRGKCATNETRSFCTMLGRDGLTLKERIDRVISGELPPKIYHEIIFDDAVDEALFFLGASGLEVPGKK